jgi:FkbM family methyltransferase
MKTRAQIESASRAAASWYPASGGRLVARIIGGMKIVLDPADFSLTPHLVMDGFWESWITAWCFSNVQSDDKVLNVGANCGYFSLLFAREAREVVAVEPQVNLAECIRWSARLNGLNNLRVVEAIAGSRHRDDVPMKLYDGLMGSAHVTEQYDAGCIRVTEVPTHELMPDATCVFVDAEGHEPQIWEGLKPILDRGIRWIVLEWAADRYADAQGFLAELRAYGAVTVITHDGAERPVSDESLLRHGDWEMVVVRPRETATDRHVTF